MTNSNIHPPSQNKTLWAWTLATVFGAGFLKPGPGTYGSIAALLLWYATAHALHPSQLALSIGTAIAAIIVTLIGIPAATTVARESGRKDPNHVVIDEAAGQLIALILAEPRWQQAVLALILFRLFDIFKPPPIRKLEQLPEGTGIMLDDVLAGIYALILFWPLAHLLSPLLVKTSLTSQSTLRGSCPHLNGTATLIPWHRSASATLPEPRTSTTSLRPPHFPAAPSRFTARISTPPATASLTQPSATPSRP